MSYVPSTGSGSALAAQNRDNIRNGTNGQAKSLVSWANALSIPTSRLMMSEIGVPISSNPVVDPNYDPGFTLAMQQMFNEFNPLNMHVTMWAGGRWRQALELFLNVDGSAGAPLFYRSTASSVLLANLKGANGVTAGRGFNLSGADFSDSGSGGGLYSGVINQQFVYPTLDDFKALQSVGITEIRFNIRQERLQPQVLGALDSGELTRLQNVLTWAAATNIRVYIDPHQYGGIDFGAATNTGYNNNTVYKLGQNAPSTQNGIAIPSGTTVEDCMNDFMIKLVNATKGYSALWGWGMGNEPNGNPNGVTDWKHYLNRTVENIRQIDTSHILFIGGYFYQGFANWVDNNGTGHLLTATIPAGQPGAGQIRGIGDANLIYDGHMYFDATGQYQGSGSSFSSLNQNAINAGYAAFNNGSNPALDITSQTGNRQIFSADMSGIGDWTVPTNGDQNSFAGSNTLAFTTLNGAKILKVTASATSDEGSIRKTLDASHLARSYKFLFGLPVGANLSTTTDYTIAHFWNETYVTGSGNNDLVEIRVIGANSSGYKVRITRTSDYTNVTGTTIIPYSNTALHTIDLEITDAAFVTYIDGSNTADATFTNSNTGRSIGGIAEGKFYSNGYIGDLYYGAVTALQPGASYDAPPNGGLYYTPPTTTTTTTTAPPTTTTTTTVPPTTTTTTTVPPTTTTTTTHATTTTTTTAAGYQAYSAFDGEAAGSSQADWQATSGPSQILNKPTLSTVATSGAYSDLSGKPNFSTVATSGSYSDLNNLPTLFSGSYTDLTNKPTIPVAVSLTTTGSGAASYNSSTGVLNVPTPGSSYITSLTTTGSGAASVASGVLNIPTPNLSGYATLTGTQTLSGNITFSGNNSFSNDLAFSGNYNYLRGHNLKISAYNGTDGTLILQPDGGGTQVTNLAGTGSRMVVTDANGLLSAQAIPSGGGTQVNSDWNASSGVAQILNKPTLATVATSGNYSDLSGKPTAVTLTTTGSGAASLSGTNVLNIPTPASPIVTSLTTTGTSGPATLSSGVLNIPQYSGGTAYTFSTGLTNTSGTITVNASQAITTLTALTIAGAVMTTAAGLLSSVANTGTGSNVLATSATLVTPVLGVATATSINKVTITAPATSATLSLVTGSTLATAGAFSITLTSTAATNVTLPTSGVLATVAGTLPIAGGTMAGNINMGTYTISNAYLASPILTTPALGTPASGVATNLTGTAAGLTAGNATTAATASALVGTTEDTAGYTYLTARQNLRATISPLSGQLMLYGFTAGVSRTISKLGISVGGTAAAGVTSVLLGLYTVNTTTGALTLVASTPASTPALAQYTPYQIGLSTSYALVAGTRYMVAALIQATTMPVLNAAAGSDDYGNNNFVSGVQQRLVGQITGQTSLPSTIADSAIGANGNAANVLMVI